MADYIVRATAADLKIRAFAITSTELVEYAKTHAEPAQKSGQQELYETILNMYL